jgi:cysteine desulfurase
MQEISEIPNSMLTGHPVHRLPNNVSFCFKGVQSDSLLLALDEKGLMGSASSACTVLQTKVKESHVLKAMGIPKDYIKGALRLTLGKWTTEKEVHEAAKIVRETLEELRN